MDRCENCEEKPCRAACPVDCSPADFIAAARQGRKSDYGRSALQILSYNPLGHVCGVLCPDTFCMAACARKTFDRPVEIPRIQAAVCQLSRELKALPAISKPVANGRKVAIVGAGPAGLGACAVLSRRGYHITLFDTAEGAGGACRSIPDYRFPKESLQADIDFVLGLGDIETKFGTRIDDAESLLEAGYDAVLVAVGEPEMNQLGIPGENLAVSSIVYLNQPGQYVGPGAKVAVIGGGAVAADCATSAQRLGAASVEMFVRRTYGEMRLTSFERDLLIEHGIDITTRTRLEAIAAEQSGLPRRLSLSVVKLEQPAGTQGAAALRDIAGTSVVRPGFDCVIMAIGTAWHGAQEHNSRMFYAGDCLSASGTVVEAVAAGKNAALEIDLVLNGLVVPDNLHGPGVQSKTKSTVEVGGVCPLPVSLATEFFGFPLSSPFIISASPHTDGFEQVKCAYEAGWAGAVLKTAFDNIPVHIPAAYINVFEPETYGNCDNVSGHSLERVCAEIGQLRKLFPERLTIGSTGGPVTGADENDKLVWQSNTKKLERSGACAIEYSLSCPQGGDGTEGDIVSQSPALTAKVVDWVMQVSDPEIPKLFKLTAAVTSIKPVMSAIKNVLAKYPNCKAGVTLANSFPVMAFRCHEGAGRWDEGVIYGMSGRGILPISFLTIANASAFGIPISGNGGVMSYEDAAHFLALGAQTVQVCTVVMKYGLNVIQELSSGLSFFMYEHGIGSVAELIGRALPNPITAFEDLSASKLVSALETELCQSCGNCVRGCGYQALSLDADRHPVTDPSRCIGCSLCVKSCFAGALLMRERSVAEKAALSEH